MPISREAIQFLTKDICRLEKQAGDALINTLSIGIPTVSMLASVAGLLKFRADNKPRKELGGLSKKETDWLKQVEAAKRARKSVHPELARAELDLARQKLVESIYNKRKHWRKEIPLGLSALTSAGSAGLAGATAYHNYKNPPVDLGKAVLEAGTAISSSFSALGDKIAKGQP